MATLEKPSPVPPAMPAALDVTQVRFQQTLAPLTGNTGRNATAPGFFTKCPWNAEMTSICFHFPLGCNALVDVAVGHSGKQAFPQEGFLALDTATPVFPVSEKLYAGEVIWVEIRNGDAVWPHTITVILILQRRG